MLSKRRSVSFRAFGRRPAHPKHNGNWLAWVVSIDSQSQRVVHAPKGIGYGLSKTITAAQSIRESPVKEVPCSRITGVYLDFSMSHVTGVSTLTQFVLIVVPWGQILRECLQDIKRCPCATMPVRCHLTDIREAEVLTEM